MSWPNEGIVLLLMKGVMKGEERGKWVVCAAWGGETILRLVSLLDCSIQKIENFIQWIRIKKIKMDEKLISIYNLMYHYIFYFKSCKCL